MWQNSEWRVSNRRAIISGKRTLLCANSKANKYKWNGLRASREKEFCNHRHFFNVADIRRRRYSLLLFVSRSSAPVVRIAGDNIVLVAVCSLTLLLTYLSSCNIATYIDLMCCVLIVCNGEGFFFFFAITAGCSMARNASAQHTQHEILLFIFFHPYYQVIQYNISIWEETEKTEAAQMKPNEHVLLYE